MALAINITNIDSGDNDLYIFGTLTPSGSYTTGGDTLDFTTVANQIGASQAPVQVWVGGATGDTYAFVRAASPTLANGKIKVNTASNTELGAGAYPGRITGDTNIQIEAVFSKLI
jgi:hypothetical protein